MPLGFSVWVFSVEPFCWSPDKLFSIAEWYCRVPFLMTTFVSYKPRRNIVSTHPQTIFSSHFSATHPSSNFEMSKPVLNWQNPNFVSLLDTYFISEPLPRKIFFLVLEPQKPFIIYTDLFTKTSELFEVSCCSLNFVFKIFSF